MTRLQLPPEIEQKLEFASKTRHTSPSALIAEALELFLAAKNITEDMEDSYEIGKVYFGKFGSGRSDLSTGYKKILKEKIHARLHID
jgi:predicted DNA-binding protein